MQIEIGEALVEIGEPDAEHESELIDGKHTAVYIDMGTFEQRMVRLTDALLEPPSQTLLELMPDRPCPGAKRWHDEDKSTLYCPECRG